jgi:hypothetical protein
LSENLKFLKTHENSHTRPLYIIDLEYEGHDYEIWSFDQFLPQTSDLRKNCTMARMYFERKIEIFKIPYKNSYRGPLCIADPEYGGDVQEIRSFGQFLLQTCDLRENRRQTPMGFERKFEIFKNQ